MSEISRLASLDSGLMQAGLGHVVAVDPTTPNNRPHVPAPPPLNGLRQGIKERLDELDMKEHEIFLERLELKCRWNRSLMVTQLPNEILILIFVYASGLLPSTDEDDGDYFKFRPEKRRWTKLMLVCRRWCDVARATPALWRAIDVGQKTAWMKLALTRSDDATIDVSFSSDFDEEHGALLEPHYHRLRSFRLRRWSPTALRVVRDSLPALESLEVLSNPHKGVYTVTDLGITRERFPNLRTLQVTRTTIPRDPLFYTRLHKLSLKGCPFKSSLEQFVQLLSDRPGLRHLELDDFLQQLSDGGNARPPRFLPSLRSLRLDNHIPMHSARFLSRIVIPAASLSITANVDLDEEKEEDDTLCAIVPPNLRTLLPRLTNVTWGRLTIVYEECSIECHPTIPEPDEMILVKLALRSDWECGLSDGIADLLSLFGSAPLTHLETLRHTESAAAGVESWARLFRAFPSLLSLEADIDDTVLAGLLEASLAGPADEPVVCRGLERITLNDECGHLREARVEVVFDPLVRCLLYRADRGSRLKDLHLELHRAARVAITEKYLPQLEKVVSNIVFGNAFAESDRY